jgi:CRISPR-associated protein Csm1
MNDQHRLQAIKYWIYKLSGSPAKSLDAEIADQALMLASSGAFEVSQQYQLTSIFNTLFESKAKGDYEFNPKELSIDLNFPVQASHGVESINDLLLLIDAETDWQRALRILRLHASYTSCGIVGFENVSIYQHIRSALAFFDALMLADKDSGNPFIFIGADLSGVQSYLYDIISTNAARNLKGRSFYLQVLTENTLQLLLKECENPDAEHWVIYNSGGGFYMLAPNNDVVKKALQEVMTTLEVRLFEEHGNSLYLALGYIEFGLNIILSGDISNLWQELTHKLGKIKRQRFDNHIVENFDQLFEPITIDSLEQDAITGEIIGRNVQAGRGKQKIKSKEGGETRYVLNKNFEQIKYGRELKKANFWTSSFEPDSQAFDRPGLGLFNNLNDELPKNRLGWIRQLNNYSADLDTYLIGGNSYPVNKEGDPKYFDALPANRNFNKLGVLRMDVDNLGHIFINGLNKQRVSFSKYAELSSKMDLFFRGYLNVLREEIEDLAQSGLKEEENGSVYILYSGGDDLFIIGDWHKAILFADKINKSFNQWVCGNSKISISGGLEIMNPKYPILKAAYEAGKREQEAKDYKNGAKNAFSVFGQVVSWNEFDRVVWWKDFWLEMFVSHRENAETFAYRLMKLNRLKQEADSTWLYKMVYDIARFNKILNSKEKASVLLSLKTNVANYFRDYDLCALGINWANYLKR